MFAAAVAWRHLEYNPTESVSRPRVPRKRKRPATWNSDQLAAFLRAADSDRFRAMWMLVATTGMRRSELAGAERRLLDLDAGTLAIEPTRVVVAGKPVDEDGKTESGQRTISLDPYTVLFFVITWRCWTTRDESLGMPIPRMASCSATKTAACCTQIRSLADSTALSIAQGSPASTRTACVIPMPQCRSTLV